MGRLFGTDGVRGVANLDLTPELAFALGRAGAFVLTNAKKRPQLVVGRDTRQSGDMLEAALTAGILSVGGDVLSAGIIPTPRLLPTSPVFRRRCRRDDFGFSQPGTG